MFSVLLYYCYTPIADPEQFREEHHRLCLELGLRGRIIVAHEGLNGTVSGTPEACAAYMAAVKADPGDRTAKQNLTGTTTYCLSAVAEYNAEARKYSSKEFRDADLPDRIDTTDPATDCKPSKEPK